MIKASRIINLEIAYSLAYAQKKEPLHKKSGSETFDLVVSMLHVIP